MKTCLFMFFRFFEVFDSFDVFEIFKMFQSEKILCCQCFDDACDFIRIFSLHVFYSY